MNGVFTTTLSPEAISRCGHLDQVMKELKANAKLCRKD